MIRSVINSKIFLLLFLASSTILQSNGFALPQVARTCAQLDEVRAGIGLPSLSKASPREATQLVAEFLEHAKGLSHAADFSESPQYFEKATLDLVSHLEKIESNPEINNDPYMKAFHTQLLTKLKHIKLDAPGGKFQFLPAIEGFKKAREFFESVSKPVGRDFRPTMPGTPSRYEENLRSIKDRDKESTRKILNDPVAHYADFSARIKKQGTDAKFEEFADIITFLEIGLSSKELLAELGSSPQFAKLRELTLAKLKISRQKGFPYLDTINVIEDALSALDVFERGRPGNQAPSLYHSMRWQYHANIMKGEAPTFIVWPTIYPLGITDLIKTRGVPIGLVGVSQKNLYADGHFQTPLEFWFHDFNHSRRMWQQYADRAKELGLTLEEYQKKSDSFVRDTVLPIIAIDKTDSAEIKDIKRLVKVILFEIIHEDALPIDRGMIKESLERAPFAIGRFVFETLDKDISKVSYARGVNSTVLALTFRKLEGEFYDMSAMRISAMGGDHVRTRKWVLKAAEYINENLDLGISPETLRTNVRDDSGIPGDLKAAVEARYQKEPQNTEPLNEAAAEEHFKRTGEMPTSVPFFGP